MRRTKEKEREKEKQSDQNHITITNIHSNHLKDIRHIEDSDKRKLISLLFDLETESIAKSFIVPINWSLNEEEAESYFEVIQRPMDIFTIKRKLKANNYISIEDCFKDISLIWENCFKYNLEDSEIYKNAEKLKIKAVSLYNSLFNKEKEGKSNERLLSKKRDLVDYSKEDRLGITLVEKCVLRSTIETLYKNVTLRLVKYLIEGGFGKNVIEERSKGFSINFNNINKGEYVKIMNFIEEETINYEMQNLKDEYEYENDEVNEDEKEDEKENENERNTWLFDISNYNYNHNHEKKEKESISEEKEVKRKENKDNLKINPKVNSIIEVSLQNKPTIKDKDKDKDKDKEKAKNKEKEKKEKSKSKSDFQQKEKHKKEIESVSSRVMRNRKEMTVIKEEKEKENTKKEKVKRKEEKSTGEANQNLRQFFGIGNRSKSVSKSISKMEKEKEEKEEKQRREELNDEECRKSEDDYNYEK